MARYFFHSDNGSPHRDAEGLELPTHHAAGLEAVRLLGELLTDDPAAFLSSEGLTITVTDDTTCVGFALQATVLRPART